MNNNSNQNAILYSIIGEKTSFVDSLAANERGEFNFELKNRHSGFYRITLNNNLWLDFVHDNEETVITSDAGNIIDNLKVIKSESNKIFYQFIKLNKDYKTKSELLQLILARYPDNDNYYNLTKEKLIQLQEEYLNFINSKRSNPGSFISRYLITSQLPVTDINLPVEKQPGYLKMNALNNVNFNDEDLIYSDAFTGKTIEYLTYYRNPQLPLELLEKEFMTAIDTILNRAKINEIVYTHITEYLLDGFKKFGFDNVIDYIVDNYVIKDELCLDEKLGDTIERRIQQARNFKTGYIVPDISLPDSSGSLVELNKIKSDRILIIFYASWCPHCKTLLPQIYEYYKNQSEKKLEVLAVSIDSSITDWLNFIRTNNLDWLNTSELKGWDGESALAYHIYATPTMFLVDRDLKLLSMPKTLDEIK